MDRLSDFRPLNLLELPRLGALASEGLVVIVGPNSSGKTQLLRDIKERISGEPRALVVASTIEVNKPDHQAFIRCLKDEGFIYSTWDENDHEQYIPMTPFFGTGQGAQNVTSQQVENWRSRSATAATRRQTDQYFGWLSRFLVTVLFLENRLTSLNAVETIDFEKQPPRNDLHALHLNDKAREDLSSEVQRAFSKAIWSDASRGRQLSLRISDDGHLPTAEERLSVKAMAKYRTIESEGDGMKSYVATAISLLLGRTPVTLIDEPELCLHPPQAYNLGQFIGRTATSRQSVTFVATHSSQILRGIVQTAAQLQIVRMTKSSDGFSARRVESSVLAEAMKKPTVRAENVLDGIFAQAVVIIEGDGDRIVYHAAWEAVGAERNFDIHFATVGGTGGIADTCQLYKVLGIPVAVIADLDVITDVDKLRKILESISSAEDVNRLVGQAKVVSDAIRSMPPTVAETEVRRKLTELGKTDFNWETHDDVRLRESLGELVGELNRMRRVKCGGIRMLPREVAAPLESLAHELASHGLFLVPVGELEEWLAEAKISASKRRKWAWANEAAQYLRAAQAQTDDIWGFVRGVGDYLEGQFGCEVQTTAEGVLAEE